MNIKCEDYDLVTVIAPTGELTADNVDAFRKEVDQRRSRNVRFFVVDLEHATFLDSKWLESLLWLQEQCDENLGQMRLCKPDDTCRKIVGATRLDNRFDIFSDVAEAVKSMR